MMGSLSVNPDPDSGPGFSVKPIPDTDQSFLFSVKNCLQCFWFKPQ